MPKYIDTDGMNPLTKEQLKKLQAAPKDQYGVTHHDILYNEEEDTVYSVLNAPDNDAVKAHHKAAGITCQWIHEVESTKV
jgi:Protein of unknown function (DUF4242)